MHRIGGLRIRYIESSACCVFFGALSCAPSSFSTCRINSFLSSASYIVYLLCAPSFCMHRACIESVPINCAYKLNIASLLFSAVLQALVMPLTCRILFSFRGKPFFLTLPHLVIYFDQLQDYQPSYQCSRTI